MAATQSEGKRDSSVDSSEEWTPEQQLQELIRRFKVLQSLQKFDKSGFSPNADDIIVVVPAKNGLTWMLHICHQIRMHGTDPDFEQQDDVSSWIRGNKLTLVWYRPRSKTTAC